MYPGCLVVCIFVLCGAPGLEVCLEALGVGWWCLVVLFRGKEFFCSIIACSFGMHDDLMCVCVCVSVISPPLQGMGHSVAPVRTLPLTLSPFCGHHFSCDTLCGLLCPLNFFLSVGTVLVVCVPVRGKGRRGACLCF